MNDQLSCEKPTFINAHHIYNTIT